MTKILDVKYKEPLISNFNSRTAMEEATRCLLCYDAPCSTDCPAGTDPGSFIRSIRFRNVKGAAETIRKNNPLGGSCSLICPHDKLCEAACSRTGIDKPIKIGELQAYAIEQERKLGMKTLVAPEEKKDKSVACIGSGPASLSCAANLALDGYDVTIFEAEEKAGGILTYGINPSRIDQEVVDHDIEMIKNLGVKFVMNKRVEGEDLKSLLDEFDAVHIGVGLGESKKIDGLNNDLEGVESALEFLKNARIHDGKVDIGESVIVIGGGDVAMDCALTAKQIGGNVSIVYRRTIEEAPANMDELYTVQQMGIPIITNFAPEETVEEDNKLVAVKFKGRDGYSSLEMKADKLVIAIGQDAAVDYKELELSDGIFASGDIANDGETVVQAVAEGKKAALEIKSYLSKKEAKEYGN